MARKKRGKTKKTVSKTRRNVKTPSSPRNMAFAWKNFVLFLIITIVAYLFYAFSSTDLFRNFFGIIAIIFGFLAFAFLIVSIVLVILKNSKK